MKRSIRDIVKEERAAARRAFVEAGPDIYPGGAVTVRFRIDPPTDEQRVAILAELARWSTGNWAIDWGSFATEDRPETT